MTRDHRGPRAAPLLRGLGWDHGDSRDPVAIPRDSGDSENPVSPNEISLCDGLFANTGSSSAGYCSNRCVMVAGSSGSAGGLAKSHGSGKRPRETHGYGHGGLLRRSDNRPRRSAYRDRRQCTQPRGDPIGLGVRVAAEYGCARTKCFRSSCSDPVRFRRSTSHSAPRSSVTKPVTKK